MPWIRFGIYGGDDLFKPSAKLENSIFWKYLSIC